METKSSALIAQDTLMTYEMESLRWCLDPENYSRNMKMKLDKEEHIK